MDQFEYLMSENKNILERFVKFKINNDFDAEDMIQEVCLQAFRKFDTLKNKDSFRAWILSIARNRCNDYYRKSAKNRDISLDALSEPIFVRGRYGITQRSIVGETLDLLNDKDKQILYLYFFKELSQEEIAKHLHVPVGTIKSRLHYAKQNFKNKYKLKGDAIMKKFPERMPTYHIKAVDMPVFPVVFEELPNWFIVPRVGEEITWASYDMPKRNITEKVHSKVVSPAFIHGIEGVEIVTESENKGSEYTESTPHIYYAQLTESHCRWLGESYIDKNGAKRLLTFLDGDDFVSEWGYGEDNCGNKTHLVPHGIIKREDNTISVSTEKNMMDVVGRYSIKINDKEYDTVCIMEHFNNGALTEQYLDKNGKTVLWRRFNRNDWAFNRYQKTWTEMLPASEIVTVNGVTYVHWYDCITEYIL